MAKREKLKEEEKRALNKENFQKLYGIFKYVLPYKRRFAAGLGFLVIGSFMMMAFPYLSGKLIDVAGGSRDFFISNIDTLALVLIGILIIQSAFSFFRVFLFAQVSENAMADVRTALFDKILQLPMAFFDQKRTGELMSRLSADVTLLQNTFSTTLAEVIRQAVTLVVGLAMIFATTPKLSLFMLAIVPVVIVVAMFFGKLIRKLSKKTQDELANSATIAEETFQAILVVKTFTNELFEIARYKKSMDEVVKTALRAAKYWAGFLSFIVMALFGAIVGILWYGAHLLQRGEITMGDLVLFVLYTAFIAGSIAGLGDLFPQIQKAIGSSERILEIHDEHSEEMSKIEGGLKLAGHINFDNVSFQYPGRKDVTVLDKLHFQIEPGQKVALVGKSGAGKSTIAQLALRMYENYDGSITIDDQEIKSLDLRAYRQNIGIVPQEVILFGGSIRENIAYGKPTASFEEIKDAADKANALDFIASFPEGFETIVGERGMKLSGGQRQRIAIARTILKNPSILILDEATSSLDAESEGFVQDALNQLMRGRTSIVIAHRLATIKNVDKILVLKDGKIMESGTHDELSEQNDGIYNHLVSLQAISS